MAIDFVVPAVVFSILFVLWVALPARPGEVDLGTRVRGEWFRGIVEVLIFIVLVIAGWVGMLGFVTVLTN